MIRRRTSGVSRKVSGKARSSSRGSIHSRAAQTEPSHIPPPDRPAFDVFISHASEDKDTVARPIADLLKQRGLRVWFDESQLLPGDSLEYRIRSGLERSAHGVVILSQKYLEKEWTRREFEALVVRMKEDRGIVIPVLHGLTPDWLRETHPDLSDPISVSMKRGLHYVADRLTRALRGELTKVQQGRKQSVSVMRVLCLTSIGTSDTTVDWRASWERAIQEGLRTFEPRLEIDVRFVDYEHLFDESVLPTSVDVLDVLWDLEAGTRKPAAEHRPPAFRLDPEDIPARKRWAAGTIAVWATNDDLRSQLRRHLYESIAAIEPNVLIAHGMGALIAYDSLARRTVEIPREMIFVTAGSQLGNVFVRRVFGGRLVALPGVFRWFDLHNRYDETLTAPAPIWDGRNFLRIDTPFQPTGAFEEDALGYLTHPATRDDVWRVVARGRLTRTLARVEEAFRRESATAPSRRALLIGVGQHRNAASRGPSTTNDVLLVSSLLQETGFSSEDITVLLDERATAATIREALRWLLEPARPDDERVLYYSGRGASLPVYNARGRVVGTQQSLVPYDFGWDRRSAIVDSDLDYLYGNLPYESRFVVILDCCFPSQALAAGGGQVARGLIAPADIRALAWNRELGMWQERALPSPNRSLARSQRGETYLGAGRATFRLGRGVALRGLPNHAYDRTRRELRHFGPYLPIVIEACREDELALDFRDGATANGAFTYVLVRALRERHALGRKISAPELIRLVATRLRLIGYAQTPSVVGPLRRLVDVSWDLVGRRNRSMR